MALSKASIREDLSVAMKAREADLTATLRMLLAAVGNAEVAGKEQVSLSEEQIIAIVRSETKKRVDTATLYTEAGRTELADKELAEVKLLARYLPAEMSDEDLSAHIKAAMSEVAAAGQSGPKAMGAVMKILKDTTAGAVDGGRMSSAVKAALA
jgi:uncharacterized protein